MLVFFNKTSIQGSVRRCLSCACTLPLPSLMLLWLCVPLCVPCYTDSSSRNCSLSGMYSTHPLPFWAHLVENRFCSCVRTSKVRYKRSLLCTSSDRQCSRTPLAGISIFGKNSLGRPCCQWQPVLPVGPLCGVEPRWCLISRPHLAFG